MAMTMLERRSGSEDETIELGRALAGVLRAGDVIALEGDLGAGKTRLVRGVALGLGVPSGAVRSPTFTLMHEYDRADQPPLIHIDAYRLRGPEDLESLGWEEAMGSGITVIEWSERIRDALPPGVLRVRLEHLGATERMILIEADGDWAARLAGIGWS